MKHQINTLLISSLIILTGQAQAGLVRDGVWKIEQGDNLKSILKSALPEQPLRQKRLKRLSPLLNKSSFDAKGELIVGQNLRLPGVKMPSNEVMQDSEQIGKILITNGPTTARAADGKQRVLNRGSAVNKGDTIQTRGARAQVRFTDGSLVALRPNTEFKVEEYSYSGQQDGSERGIYNLLKGGFRTISGAIGKVNKSNYKVKTPVATIGIRGTHYGVTLCSAGSCADQGLADGLYGGVVDGSIKTTNDGGSQTFNNDEYFLISDLGSLAQLLLAPPGVIFDDPASAPTPTEEETKEKEDALTKRVKKVVAAILEEKKPDFDGTLDSEKIREIVTDIRIALQELPPEAVDNIIKKIKHPELPGTEAAQGTIVGFSFVGNNPINQIVPSEPAVGSVAQTVQHNGSTQNISTGSSALVSSGSLPGNLQPKSSVAAAVAMFDILQGLSYEEIIGDGLNAVASIITDPAAQGAELVHAEDSISSMMGLDLGLSWGRWVDTPIKIDTVAGSATATPGTGVIFALADATKVITDKNILQNVAERTNGSPLSGALSMNSLGIGVAPVNLSGQQGSGSSNLTLDFGQGKLMFDVTALINDDTYALQTAAGGVSIDSIISPGSHAELTGTCSASTGGICGNSTALSGAATFIFTDSTPGAASGGTLGTAVNYAGHGTTANGTPVGIAGVEIFTDSCTFC